jgi:CRP-like cAMP-binding protein
MNKKYLSTMNGIRKHLERFVTLTDHDWEIFSSKLIKREFSKKSILLKVGQNEKYLSFIEQGIVRFYIPTKLNDITFGFAFDNNFVSAYDFFLTQEPSNYQLETITNTILWSLNYDDLQEIYTKTDVGNKIGRLASEDLFLKKSKRELSLLTESAERRYLNLFKEQPHLLKLIPLKYIASYIGITPQALSRIRKRIS